MAATAIPLSPDLEWPHRIRSVAFLAMGKRQPALMEAEEAVRLAPADPMTHAALANARLARRQFRAATESAKTVLSLAPNALEGHELQARIAFSQRRWQEAEARYRKALSLDPLNWVLMNDLGLALRHLGRKREAIEALENAAKLNPRAKLAQDNLFQHVGGFVVNRILYLLYALLGIAIAISLSTWLKRSFDAGNPVVFSVMVLYVVVGVVGSFVTTERRKRTLSRVTQTFIDVRARRNVRGKGLYRFAWFMGAYVIFAGGMAAVALLNNGALFFLTLAAWSVGWWPGRGCGAEGFRRGSRLGAGVSGC